MNSGAEGTIIEEPDNLPRMIWGLDQDATHTTRPQGESIKNQPTPRKVVSRSAPPPVVPPRFAKAKEQIVVQRQPSPTVAKTNVQPISSNVSQTNLPQTTVPRHQAIYEQAQLEQAFSGHGPIDLSTVLRPRSSGNHPHASDHRSTPPDDLLYESHHHGSRNYGSNEGGLDWRSIQAHQGASRTGSRFAGTPSEEDMAHYLKPSMSTSSSLASLSSLASSCSLSTIDSPNMDFRYHSGQTQGQTTHRMSALEIAHKYRQEQVKQGQQPQNILPTPPSTSSPIWSSRVSPHQGSLASPYSDLGLSPELAMSSNLPAIINYLNQTNLQRLAHQTENPLRTPVDDMSRSAFASQKAPFGNSPLSTTGSINSDVVNLHDLRNSIYSSEILRLDHMAKFLHTQNRANALGFSSIANITPQSPSQPRPPPNTPSAVIARTRAAKMEEQRRALRQTSLMPAPPSPQSPELQPRNRTLSLQNPRSIPLTQLIQRSLSSVPEEDYGASLDCGDIPSPEASPPQRSRSFSSSEAPTSARKIGTSRQAHPPTIRPLDTVLPPLEPSQGPIQAQNYRKRSNTRPVSAVTTATQPLQSPVASRGRPGDSGAKERGGRGRGRGRRGGRGGSMPVRVNGPERVDGGMTVRC